MNDSFLRSSFITRIIQGKLSPFQKGIYPSSIIIAKLSYIFTNFFFYSGDNEIDLSCVKPASTGLHFDDISRCVCTFHTSVVLLHESKLKEIIHDENQAMLQPY